MQAVSLTVKTYGLNVYGYSSQVDTYLLLVAHAPITDLLLLSKTQDLKSVTRLCGCMALVFPSRTT